MSADAGTLAGVIARAALDHPVNLAVIDDLGALTFAELDSRISASVAAIDSLVAAGDPIAVIGPNHRIWVELYYAVPASGRVLVFLNHRLNVHELESMIARSGARLVIGDADELDRLRTAEVDVPHSDWTSWSDRVDGFEVPSSQSSADLRTKLERPPTSPAWMLFTSGTTTGPKGALLSHSNVLAAVRASTAARPVERDDVYVFPFPLCHVAGYNVVHRHALGRPVVLMSGFAASEFCDVVEREQATSASLAATMLATLVDLVENEPERRIQLESLRSIAYGAAPMPTPLLRQADALLNVEFAQGYGMTELSGNAVFLNAEAHRRGLDEDESLLKAAGTPAPGVEMRIVDELGRDVESGEAGEIVIRAEQVMLEYLDDPVATEAALHDGWLHTGDIGRIIDGLLYVVDRKKDIVITGGENVSSVEVESAVLAHPDIARVAVVGVPDMRWGENVCAVVVATSGAVIDAHELSSFVRESLAGYKVPRHVVVVDELPVNASGKVVKVKLREWLAQNPEMLGSRL
ncbi:MAG: AMP-binding protein [Actinomycetes bacterium]